jgi:hypothetical protein
MFCRFYVNPFQLVEKDYIRRISKDFKTKRENPSIIQPLHAMAKPVAAGGQKGWMRDIVLIISFELIP